MTLKTKIRISAFIALLILEAIQFYIINTFFIGLVDIYVVIVFLAGTTVLFTAALVFGIESIVMSKIYLMEKSLDAFARSHSNIALLPVKSSGSLSRVTDYLDKLLEELQLSENNLEESRKILLTAQKHHTLGSWDIDLRTGKVHCAEQMYRLVGPDATDLFSGYSWMAHLIYSEDRQSVKKNLQAAVQDKKLAEIDYTAILPGGSRRSMHIEGEVSYDDVSRLYRIYGLLYDKTRQITYDGLQSTNREEHFNMFDLNPNPVLIIDGSMSVQYINAAFEKMSGYSADEILGATIPYPWWPVGAHEKYKKEFSKEISSGRNKAFRRQLKKKNGRNIWVEESIRSLKNEHGTEYSFIYLTDITRQLQLQNNMQYYRLEMTNAQEAERKRIAGELHDEILQSLASFSLEIDSLSKEQNMATGSLPGSLQKLRDGVQEMAGKLRWLSHELHPSVIDQGLVPALEDLVQQASKDNGLNIRLVTFGDEKQLPVEKELALLRVAQEAVRNIIKHSGATEVVIKLRYYTKKVKLIISDNGIGFKVPEIMAEFAGQHKLGMIGMQERCNVIDGQFTVKSRIGKGTTISAAVEASTP